MIWILLAANGGVTLPTPQPEIIVTGSRVATTADDIAANVTVLKRDELPQVKDKVAIELMRGIKAMLDPLGIMNPGKVL